MNKPAYLYAEQSINSGLRRTMKRLMKQRDTTTLEQILRHLLDGRNVTKLEKTITGLMDRYDLSANEAELMVTAVLKKKQGQLI